MKTIKPLIKSIIKNQLKSHKSSSQCENFSFDINGISDYAFERAKKIRNPKREPAIIIHGVMQRTGTVYVGELLRLHPDIYAYPNEVWEVPFLKFLDNLVNFQANFFKVYPYNKDKIGEQDFLPLFGASFIDYLYSLVPDGKRMLLKVPSVDYLNYFFAVFPYENLLVLMRDGRDVVTSHLKTWTYKQFSDVCQEWDCSTKMALKFDSFHKNKTQGYLTAKYEDILKDPSSFAEQACQCFGLDSKKFPYEKINSIPVHGSSSLKNGDQTTWKPITKPKNFQTVGRWKNWSKEQTKVFKTIAGQTLIDAGYHDNFDW